MVKWVLRTPGEPVPQYDSGKHELFTIEMHFNGLLTANEYLYGSVACFDRVDPDFLSMIELNAMADWVNVEGDFYHFLWPHPGKGIAEGLQSIECEDHVLAFIKARQNIDDNGNSMGAPFGVMTLYVKKLSEFEARKRIGEIKMELHRPAIEGRVQFRLEEMNDDGDVECVSTPCTGTAIVSGSGHMLMLPWSDRATVVHSSVEGNSQIGKNASEVPPLTADVEVNDTEVPTPTADVEVNDTEVPPLTADVEVNDIEVPPLTADVEVNDIEVPTVTADAVVNNSLVPPGITDVEVNDTEVPTVTADAEVNLEDVPHVTNWLGVEEVMAAMEREEAMNEPLEDLDEYWSSPTIPSSPDTPGEFWDGRYNPFSSEDDTDPAYEAYRSCPSSNEEVEVNNAHLSSPSSTEYAPSYNSNSSSESESLDSEVRGQDLRSEAGSNGEAGTDARNEDDECDHIRDEEDMIGDRGWGSEEDDDPAPDRYPIFCSARDLQAAEIVIGREYESFAQFKQFCKGLQNILERRFPYAEHRYCVQHLYVNFGDKFNRGKALRSMFWAACKASNKAAFDDAMAKFREKGDRYMTEEGLTPLEWMQRRGVHSWCKYYFETLTTCDISLNNHCESFNKWILEARDMPILSCLETIRFKMMKRVVDNFLKVANREPESLCRQAYVIIKERKKLACLCYPTFNGDGQFEVREGLKSWVVDVRSSQCACGLWQLSGGT
ncbi:hypothetical protein LINPERHAP2_LOCUS36047 [Linum perenne]